MKPHRTLFWQIQDVWVFYVLAGLAIAVFLAGIAAHILVWKRSARSWNITFSKDAFKRVTLDTLLGRRVLRGDISAGLMHLCLFWGFFCLFIGTILLSIHHYITPFLVGMPYLVFSLVMDMSGGLLLVGLLWALTRRYIQRVSRLERRWEDGLVPLWLLLVVLSGFMLEGLRMAVEQPTWGEWSYFGWWVGSFFSAPAARDLYPFIWWGHGLLSLTFVASIPFTKLFHVLGAPAAVYFQDTNKPITLELDEVAGQFELGETIFFDACMRCGRCDEACPSEGAGEPFSPRNFVQAMRHAMWQEHFPWGDIRFLGRKGYGNVEQKFWYCTTCRACLEVCPVYGAAYEAVLKKRVLAVEEGIQVPKLLSQTLEKLSRYDNPWESSRSKRAAWAEEMGLVVLTEGGRDVDLCYFVGCTTSFDDNAQGIARSFSKILKLAGVRFGILGKNEPCCGDIARRAGEIGLFEEQIDKCLSLFERYGITEVVTSSPHCFHTFRNEYPKAPFRVRHDTQLLRELLVGGRLQFNKRIPTKVTYHDPCYLGRHNGIFEEPREIIRSIPGLELVEMDHHGRYSLCCGGGGARMWQDLDGEVKMSDVRIREAQATGASLLITACPLCRIMLEDARKTAGLNDSLRVMDLNELVLEALEGSTP